VTTPIVVLMGVSGCGKSSVGVRLAAALGVDYVEGDEWHPPGNIERMRSGTPLTDEDRHDWLRALAMRLAAARASGRGLVLACSALKRRYRDVLRSGAPGLRLVHLHGPEALLEQRLAARSGHYMPASLLASQLATLEAPAADEAALAVDVSPDVETLVARLLQQLSPPP
jgi:gluconokinase